jgi:hypothetical protein
MSEIVERNPVLLSWVPKIVLMEERCLELMAQVY